MIRHLLISLVPLLTTMFCRADAIDVSQVVSPVAQITKRNCWAAVAAMLVSWKRSQAFTMEQVVSEAGAYYLSRFKLDLGLKAEDDEAFYTRLGMKVKKGQSFTIQAWANLIGEHGPIGVTIAENYPSIHGWVITGMKGDGSAEGTMVSYIDPEDGKAYSASFSTFVRLYERAAQYPVQVVYW